MIIKASRRTPASTWIIECDNHDNYVYVREYEPIRDVFICTMCSTEVKAEQIYWSLPEVSKDGN